jgi:hypothetical protein
MQPSGDLVLRDITSGEACWASRTRAPGDAVARLGQDSTFQPFREIVSTSQGRLAFIDGSLPTFVTSDEPVNASVNNKGEFYVGFTEVASC